jgi:hypothetical protein
MGQDAWDSVCRREGIGMKDILRFPFIKTLSTILYEKGFGLSGYPQKNPIDQDFLFRIRYGNLLKDSGDILLCPLSESFKPSNPLSISIIKKEGKWLDKEIKNLYSSDNAKWIGSEHVAFLPCRKLKYRGILFVCVDFYSKDREKINAGRIAEALEIAAKYNCSKLSCPQNLLYNPEENYGYDYIHSQFDSIFNVLGSKTKINFVIETVIQKTLKSFHQYESTAVFYDFSTSLVEYLPDCAQILQHYRKSLKKIRTVYSFSTHTQKQIKALLTKPINEKSAFILFKKLFEKMGGYEESEVGRYNDGFDFFLLDLCREMPWNFFKILDLLKKFTDLYKGKVFEDFIYNERFKDLSPFEYYQRGQ